MGFIISRTKRNRQGTEKSFWQCGTWVPHRRDASIYPTMDEAQGVIALRNLKYAEAQETARHAKVFKVG